MKNAKSHGQAPLLAPHIDRLRSVSYSALAERARRSDLEAFEAIDADGDAYQMEILYLWNGKREGDIRVMGFAFCECQWRVGQR